MTFLSTFYIYRKLRRKVRYGMSQSHHPLTQTIYIHHEYSHSHFCDNHLILLSVVYSELSFTQKVLVSLLIFLSYKSELNTPKYASALNQCAIANYTVINEKKKAKEVIKN